MKLKPGNILAQHEWNKDLKGAPLVSQFSPLVWNNIPPYTGPDPVTGRGQVNVPKQGWKQISADSLVTPKAALEAMSEGDDQVPEMGFDPTPKRRR